MTENELRQKYANVIIGWKGRKESDGSHKAIIDLYNGQTKLPRGYKVKYTDAWCATTVSAAAIKAGLTSIIPIECSCPKMIDIARTMGIWKEADNYKPSIGDIVLYDWQDGANYATTDNVGTADHIGVVTNTNGNSFTVTEGNKNDSVCDRQMTVNGRYIRGFICPNFSSITSKVETKPAATKPSATQTTTKPVANTITKSVTATERARTFDKSVAGEYIVTASSGLNVRNGASIDKSIIVTIPKGTKVRNFGYCTKNSGVNWLYIQVKYNKVTYTGFCSSKYLRKA